MSSHDFVFSNHASLMYRELIEDLQQVSLLSAERVRSRIMHKLHLIHHQPMQSSKKFDIGIEGNFRVTSVLNYKIYYVIEKNRICVVDMLMDKGAKRAS